MLKRTYYNKVYIWSSRKEIRHETQTVIFKIYFLLKLYFKIYFLVKFGSISASEYEDNPLDRQERAGISKDKKFCILHLNKFSNPHKETLRTKCWEHTFHISSDSQLGAVSFLYLYLRSEVQTVILQVPAFQVNSTILVFDCICWVFLLEVDHCSQTLITAEFKLGIRKWK